MMNMNIEELDPNEEMGGEEFTSPGSTKFPIGVETDVTKDGGIKKTVIVEGSGWDTVRIIALLRPFVLSYFLLLSRSFLYR